MALGRRILGALVRLRIRLLPPLTIGVRAVVVDPAGRIALVRHTYDERWYLPGGGVEAGEAIAAAIQREVREELGLDGVVPDRVIGLFLNLKEGRDDHVVLFLMRAEAALPDRLSTAAPFEIAEAADGMEALAWCRAAMPDAILLDWNMPVMSGMEFLRSLGAADLPARPKVVFCTTENDLAHIKAAIEAGADEYMMKPFDRETLESKLQLVGVA